MHMHMHMHMCMRMHMCMCMCVARRTLALPACITEASHSALGWSGGAHTTSTASPLTRFFARHVAGGGA